LLVRTSWGATPAQIAQARQEGLQKTLERLTTDFSGEVSAPWPKEFGEGGEVSMEQLMEMRKGDSEAALEARKDERKRQQQRIRDMRAWWLREMSVGHHPLREQMTLFWHGHFVSSFQKVRSAEWMWRQNQLFRKHALGSMNKLAAAIVFDPAMMRYLDIGRNRAKAPNENFARELFELFLLGEGHYTEEDIREAARAFTGNMLQPASGEVRFRPALHDSGNKRIFGKAGTFDAHDVVELTMQQPACAPFLAGKIWIYFAGKEPTPEWARTLGNELRKHDFNTAAFLRAMLASPEFYDPRIVGKSIKSPVHWLVGTSRLLDAPLDGNPREQAALVQLGQNIFLPPNVRGWEGGTAWINTTTLPARHDFARRLFLEKTQRREQVLATLGVEEASNEEQVFAVCTKRLFPVGLSSAEETRLRELWAAETGTGAAARPRPAKLLDLLFASPEFQLT
jgi:uncharacterized protein (DUF1800 family)